MAKGFDVCPRCKKEYMRNGHCFGCGYNVSDGEIVHNSESDDKQEQFEMIQGEPCPRCGSTMTRDRHCFSCNLDFGMQQAIVQQQMPQMTIPPNLAPCPDCGRLVSMYATSCPSCGRPLMPLKKFPVDNEPELSKNEDVRNGNSGCGVFVAVVVGIIVAVWIISKLFHLEITGTIVPMK